MATRRIVGGIASVLVAWFLLALFSLAVLSRLLNTALLSRLDELAAVAEAVARGGVDRRAAAEHTDELGVVARELNAVLDRQEELRNLMEARATLYRELLMGLLDALHGPAALLGLDGRILASTFDRDTDRLLEHAASRFPLPPDGPSPTTLPLTTETLTLQTLCSPGERPLAWLASRGPGASDTT